MKFLVTGGTGYIGSACIRRLLGEGHEVRATTRNMALAKKITDYWHKSNVQVSNLSWHELDLLNENGWKSVVDGCDIVLHVASPVPKSLNVGFEELVVPAAKGVDVIMTNVAGSTVKRVVLTSSIAAIRNSIMPMKSYDHTSWSDLSNSNISSYAFSKTYAEMLAWRHKSLSKAMPELVAIHPGFVIGAPAFPEARSASVNMVKRILNAKFPLVMPLYFNMVALDDVVDLHLASALASAVDRQRFPCCGDAVSIPEICNWLYEAGLLKKRYSFNCPKLLVPKKYSVFFNDNVHINCENSISQLGWKQSSIKKAIIGMAKYIRNNELN